MRRFGILLAVAAAASCGAPALAAETISYSYDARGRLVQVQRTGPVNKTTAYQLDKADNRLVKTTS